MSGFSTSQGSGRNHPCPSYDLTAIFHHHPPVSAITDAQAALCDHDLWPAKPEPVLLIQYFFDKQRVSSGQDAHSEKAAMLLQPPQNGNLGGKSNLSLYFGIFYGIIHLTYPY
jgi:hypothetical protein